MSALTPFPSPLRTSAFALSLAALLALSACGGNDDPVIPPAVAEPVEQFVPPEPPSGFTPKAIAYANRDMVSAANPLAVNAGVDILARGGSAVDAAIAVQMVLNLVEPQSSGIGGGAFLMHFDRGAGRLLAYDGRETAPRAATGNMFIGANGQPLGFTAAVDGGLSVGTPGLVRMLEAAHRAHGRLPWADLFAPAIALADNGFEISARMSTSIAGSADRIRAQGEPGASYFLQANGTAKTTGTLLRNPEFAATLRTIAAGGANAFYTGAIAQDIVNKVRNHPTNPGRMTMEDLAGYTHRVREPVCGVYRVTYRVCGMPTPSSGGITTLQTLGILQQFDVARLGANTADSVHLISEAYRLAYADRARYIADSDFIGVPTAGLLDPAYLRDRAQLISMTRSIGTPTAGTPPGAQPLPRGIDNSLNLPSTSHVSIIDRNGNAVSMTTTIENGFGSLQMVRGFLLNNQLTDFSFTERDADGNLIANRVEPLKRPRSSMAPTVVFHAQTGDLEGVIGSPGGSAIIQYVTKSLVGMIDWRLNVQQAINLPNFGAQTNATTSIEQGSAIDNAALRDNLAARGHTVARTTAFTSGLHGAVFNSIRPNGDPGQFARNPGAGVYAGGSDPRREGISRGNN